MCLGDIRFLPFIRSRIVSIDVTTTFTELLPVNTVRVGLFVPSIDFVVGRMAPFAAPSQITEGYIFSNDSQLPSIGSLTWKDWGDIIQANWFFRSASAQTINVIESVVPAEIMQKIRKLGNESLEFSLR